MRNLIKYAIIAITITTLLGCRGDKMAVIGEETNSVTVSTNVVDTTPIFDSNLSYQDGDIVQKDNQLYVVHNEMPKAWDTASEYIIGDTVSYSGLKYEAQTDLRFSPEDINVIFGGSNGSQNTYRWFLSYGTDSWVGSGSSIYYKVPGAFQGITYTFTLQSGESIIYDVHIVSDSGSTTDEVWTVFNSFDKSHAIGSYFAHNGRLWKVESINNKYNSPDSTSIVSYIIPWKKTETSIKNLVKIGSINPYKPFDGQNITPAISSSPMTYTIKGTEPFNSFTLAKVLASQITYTFKNSAGATVKTETIAIDCYRDENGILSLYPTTVVYYAGQQMEANSTVEITLTHSSDVELGDFTLNNTINAGFTNLSFKHGIKDYNSYVPDAWGNIPERVKAIVTTFDITLDIYLTSYDHAVSFMESIAGKNVVIDASDSNGALADGANIFNSLTRRVRVTNISSNSVVKDGKLFKMANSKLSVQEIV